MNMLKINDIVNTFEYITKIKGNNEFIDIHVHPFDVVYDDQNYMINENIKGVFSINNATYACQKYNPISIDNKLMKDVLNEDLKVYEKLLIYKTRKVYAHTGPKVLYDHMKLSKIDKVFLLPVSGYIESKNNNIENIQYMFGSDNRFVFGYSLRNSLSNKMMEDDIKYHVNKYNIKLIKIHPNITGIDTGSKHGVERIESILGVANNNELLVLIHGGKSALLKNMNMSEYGTIEKLFHINWKLTKYPVVIAHAGTYGYESINDNIENIRIIQKMMGIHDNIWIDISGVPYEIMHMIFEYIDNKRILFGSDSLYTPQWEVVIKLFHSLKNNYSNYEEMFLNIMSINPLNIYSKTIKSRCMPV